MLLKNVLVICFLFLCFASAGQLRKRGPPKGAKGHKGPKGPKGAKGNRQRGKTLGWIKLHAWEKGSYFEGDIIKSMNAGRHVVRDVALLWPDHTVPYVISAYYTASQKEKIKEAMAVISKGSCIKFVPRSEDDENFVYFVGDPGSGCGTQVGFQKNSWKCYVHYVYLEVGKGCLERGVILHELLHVLGFFHQQNAPNRDAYIHIYWGNVMPNKTDYFKKRTDSETFDLFYDYNSIMHSSATAFSIDGISRTILPKNNPAPIGQREVISRIDWQKLNRRYEC